MVVQAALAGGVLGPTESPDVLPMLALLPLAALAAAGGPHAPALPADGSIVDLFKATGPGGGDQKNISSMWGPGLVVTKNNTVVAFGQCDRSPSSHDSWMAYVRSFDGGATWQPQQTLYGCGSPAGIYSPTSDTIFVLFGDCAKPKPPGPPYGLSEMSCKGGTVHWQYNESTQHLRSTVIPPPNSPLGVEVCEGAVKPIAGDALGVGMPPDQSEPCPAIDLKWKIEGPPTDYVRHVDTGLCLTIPPRKSAVLEPCGAAKSAGQKFVWDGATLKLAPGMYRAGECLGYRSKAAAAEEEQELSAGSGDGADAHSLEAAAGSATAEDSTGKPSKLCTVTQLLYCNRTQHRQVLQGYPACKACLGTCASAAIVQEYPQLSRLPA
jgi:hypothetical protein